jgi:hypothetical protein
MTGPWWLNWEERQFHDLYDAIMANPDGTKICGDHAPTAAGHRVCTRAPGHPGRHIATGAKTAALRIVAAWPGTLPPTLEDLEEAAPC